MRDILPLIGYGLLILILVPVAIVLLAALMVALFSPLILIVWLIIQAVT